MAAVREGSLWGLLVLQVRGLRKSCSLKPGPVQSDFSLGVMERLGGGRNISVVRGGQVLVHMDMSNQQVDWALSSGLLSLIRLPFCSQSVDFL